MWISGYHSIPLLQRKPVTPEAERAAQLRSVVAELIEHGNAMARGDSTHTTQAAWDAAAKKAWNLIK